MTGDVPVFNYDFVYTFANEMCEVLKRHMPKKGDSWMEVDLRYLEICFRNELDKHNRRVLYKHPPDYKELKGICVDAANYAMMLWHRYQVLENEPTEGEGVKEDEVRVMQEED